MSVLHLDFETASDVDLPHAGAHIYAQHESTRVLMMAWAFDDEPTQLWLPKENVIKGYKRDYMKARPFPSAVREHIESGGVITAFNAQFERLILWHVICPMYDIAPPAYEQFHCTAAQARANNLPGNLFDCARALDAPIQKHSDGPALIRMFCTPPHESPHASKATKAHWINFCEYCIADVDSERAVEAMMRQMTPTEHQDYWVSERVNDEGLGVDVELAEAARNYAEEEQRACVAEIARLTNGEILKARGVKLTDWVFDNIPAEAQMHMIVFKNGEPKLSLAKHIRERLLSLTVCTPIPGDLDYWTINGQQRYRNNDMDAIPEHVRSVIEYTDFAQAASTAKFHAMILGADPEDQRVRGSFVFNGAAGTGRFSARRVQPHNFPRFTTDNAHEVADMMCEGAPAEDITALSGVNMMKTLKGLLRFSIQAADGYEFVCGDWSQIEGRANPWLAMGINDRIDRHIQAKLAIYADPSRDVYCETAGNILGLDGPIDPDDPRRQGYGKVPELSLGFGGGENAFAGMAAGYGVHLSRAEIGRIVSGWRASNPWAQAFWVALERAAMRAVRNPMEAFDAGRVSYLFQPGVMGDTLWCLLPSGRFLAYPQARIDYFTNKFGNEDCRISAIKAAWKPKAGEKNWPRNYLWGGLQCENVTQGISADILRWCMRELDVHPKQFMRSTIGHTHDEVLLEVLKRYGRAAERELEKLMTRGPDFAEGLPLACEIWRGDRYRK